jgi:site-specific recombinase XerD
MGYPIKFILRDDRVNSKGKCPIYLRYTFRRKFVNLPLKYSIPLQFWNKEDGKPRNNYPNFRGLRTLLGEFEDKAIKSIENFMDKNGVLPEASSLKDLMNGFTLFQIHEGSGEMSVRELFKDYIDYQKGDGISKSTLNIYDYTWKKWCQYENGKKHIHGFKELNFQNLSDFRVFLKSGGLQKNTVSKYIKTMKSFLSYLELHKELPVAISYKKVKVEQEFPEIQVLSQEELDILKREVFFTRNPDHKAPVFNLTDNERKIGQILFFLCHTGLSYVDFDRLRVKNLVFLQESKGTKELQIHISRKKLKSVANCKIPILDVTIDLLMDILGIPHSFIEANKEEPTFLQLKINTLESFLNKEIKAGSLKLDSRIFPKVVSQLFNREIKEVLKKIEINSPVVETRFFGGKESIVTLPKHEVVSSHTGRRTFITRSIENGVSTLVLMDMTGHTKVQTLTRYAKNSPEFIQREVKSKTPGQIEFKGETLNSESVKKEKKTKK